MDNQELDERLRAADPARRSPVALDRMIDQLVSRTPIHPPRRRWHPVVVVGGSLALASALVAGTDLGTVLLSNPPFAGLEHGATFRPATGLAYVPVAGADRGEQCKLYIDLGGLTGSQEAAVSDYWSSADSDVFAIAVGDRIAAPELRRSEPLESIELWAAVDQILIDLDAVVPGIQWGTAAPGQSFDRGDPHLTTVTRACDESNE